MTIMPWSQDFSVGMAAIDTQHHWLVDAMNQLHTELEQPQPNRAVVGRTLEGLMDYTVNHFVMEEELFGRHGYPQAAAHKALHDHFTRTVMQRLTEFEAGQDIGGEVVSLLKDWLIGHIMGADKAYAPFLLARMAPQRRIAPAPGVRRPARRRRLKLG